MKKQHGPIVKLLIFIIRIFVRKPKIVNYNKEFEKKAIFIANHSAISGPLFLALYLPSFFVPWGTYEMTEKFKKRWRYLYHHIYRDVIGANRLVSFVLSTFFASISKMLYKGAQLIPTYPDARFLSTLRTSEAFLNIDIPILIFPEDFVDGFKVILEKYLQGFVGLSSYYFQQTGIDLPIYPISFHKKKRVISIGKPEYVEKLSNQGYSKIEIANHFMDLTNQLYFEAEDGSYKEKLSEQE
jgi:hypothetical protein